MTKLRNAYNEETTNAVAQKHAQIAQSVEQRIENPRVGGSIPPLGTISKFVFIIHPKTFCFDLDLKYSFSSKILNYSA